MRDNNAQAGLSAGDGRRHIEYDWYAGSIPANVSLGEDVYIDTSYGFAAFFSEQEPGLALGRASGAYDRSSFIVGPRGQIHVGSYTVLNGCYLVANRRIHIGDHCLIAWGSVFTDTWAGIRHAPIERRREILRAAAAHPSRLLAPIAEPRPITLEDNVWVGFDSVVLPGVTLGRGSIIGCKTIIDADVPPYAVMVGDPARPVRYLDPDDTDEARSRALREHSR